MKKLLLFYFIIIMISACDDVLNEVPKDFISAENFYQNTQQIEDALTGAYHAIWNEVDGNSYKNYLNLHNDYTRAMGSFASVGNFDAPLGSDTFGRVNGFWSGHYRQINRANIVLDRTPLVEDMNEDTRSRILAEAHFLRGYAYFELLRYWGPAPLRTEEFTGATELAIPRAPKEEMYDLIISDILNCERDCLDDVGSNTQRASKGAAKMLLAQVYLDKEDWDNAAEKADELINNSQYSLISINEPDDFYEIFATTDTSVEEIMAHHFSEDNRPTYLRWWHTESIYNRGQNWGDTNLPRIQTDFIQNWDEDDLRRDFNLFSSWVDEDGVTHHLPEDGVGSLRYKKYIKHPSGLAVYNQPIYRLAEAYLIYAEAAAMANGTPTPLALERLNIIKRRGYGYDPYSSSPVDYNDGMSINEFRDAVLLERAYEFFMEDRRWWDLKRTGMAAERITEATGITLHESRLLFPLPSSEIETNPAINQSDQNPGY